MTLLERLEAAAGALTKRVLAEMFANPFWRERFGERATKHGRQDGHFHLTYVIEALRANDVSVIERYARWLQQVLCTRGMCTRHLDDNFARLAVAIDETVDDAAPAIAMLAAARAALVYEGHAGELQRRAPDLAQRAADELYAAHPDRRGRERCADDLQYHLAYATDAIALAMPKIYTDHVAWITSFFERRGIGHLDESLDVLRRVAAAELPDVSWPG